ncbi:MAG TPA: hypothetical protein PLO67_20685 [Saprospiraceae bacterium]|nr:hypothetical protein [Saprospiraceae bacterium]HPI08938.1 hypothetical protein [Saprospiraceae bacterium]
MIDLTSNRISALLSAEELAATKSDLDKVSQRLSFLVQLTQKEIERMYKISDADKTFVRNCLAEMSGASDITPPYLNAEEISRDLACNEQLLELENTLSELLLNVRRNRILAGKEAYNGASVFYRLVATAARSGSGPAQAIHERLQKHHHHKIKSGRSRAAQRAQQAKQVD